MRRAFCVALVLLLTAALGHAAPPGAAPIALSAGGVTTYRVVPPDQPSKVDGYAIQTLTATLKQTLAVVGGAVGGECP
jgi:hypothetical protein